MITINARSLHSSFPAQSNTAQPQMECGINGLKGKDGEQRLVKLNRRGALHNMLCAKSIPLLFTLTSQSLDGLGKINSSEKKRAR